MSSQALLEIDDLVAGYGSTKVLKGIALNLAEGEALAVLGANGAGKSTLMKTIAGLIDPWQGTISFDGQRIDEIPADERPALGLALAPEGRDIFSGLTIEENLTIGATCLRHRHGAAEAKERVRKGLDRIYSMFDVLGRRRHDNAAGLSGGQQQMLAIGRALIAEPRLLLMDEPCLGLAPKVGRDVYGCLAKLREQGQSLIVVEESSRRALDFVDRACIIKLGEKVAEDRAEALKDEKGLLEAYFGITNGSSEQGQRREEGEPA